MQGNIIIVLILNFIFSCNIFAQAFTFQDTTNSNNNSLAKVQNSSLFNYNRLHFSLNIGAGYIGGSNLYSGAYTSISPSINYQITPRFNIQTGVTMISGLNNFSPTSNHAMQSNFGPRPSQYILYGSGQYLLTKNLTVFGSAYKTVNANNSAIINPYFLDYKAMDIGLNYKITEHMNVSTSINFTNNPFNSINQNVFGVYSPIQIPNGW